MRDFPQIELRVFPKPLIFRDVQPLQKFAGEVWDDWLGDDTGNAQSFHRETDDRFELSFSFIVAVLQLPRLTSLKEVVGSMEHRNDRIDDKIEVEMVVVLVAFDGDFRNLFDENFARIRFDQFDKLIVVNLRKLLLRVQGFCARSGQKIAKSVCELGVQNSENLCVAVV